MRSPSPPHGHSGSPTHSFDSDGLELSDESSLREITYRRADLEAKLQVGTEAQKRLREKEALLKSRVAQLASEFERIAAELDARRDALTQINDDLQDELASLNVETPFLQDQLAKLKAAEKREHRDFTTVLLQMLRKYDVISEVEPVEDIPEKLTQLVEMVENPALPADTHSDISELQRRIALYQQACESQNAQTQQQISRLAKEVARLEEMASEADAVVNALRQVGGDRSELVRHGGKYCYRGISFGVQKVKGNLMMVDDNGESKLLRTFIQAADQQSLSASFKKSG
jgi:chromosome segregation ATPase